MNKTLIILSLVVLASCDAKVQVPSKNLVERDSIKYEVNSQTPFTGSYVSALCSKEGDFTKFCTSLAIKKGLKEAIFLINLNREKVNLNRFSKNLTNELVISEIKKNEDYYIFLSNLNNYPNTFNSILQKKAHMSLFVEKEVSIEKLNVLEEVIDVKNIKEIADSI